MTNKDSTFFEHIIAATNLSITYVSSIFLAELLSYKLTPWEFIYLLLIAILFGFSLISANKKDYLIRWGLSFPLSFVILQYFHATSYSIRGLNWIFPGYGDFSAGGGFASIVLWIFFNFFCLLFGIICLFINPKRYDKFRTVQRIISFVTTGMIVIAVIVLQLQFPKITAI